MEATMKEPMMTNADKPGAVPGDVRLPGDEAHANVSVAAAVSEMTPVELFDKARSHRLNDGVSGSEALRRRADARPDGRPARRPAHQPPSSTGCSTDCRSRWQHAQDFRERCIIRLDNVPHGTTGLNCAYLGAAISTIAWLFLWILLRA